MARRMKISTNGNPARAAVTNEEGILTIKVPRATLKKLHLKSVREERPVYEVASQLLAEALADEPD